jgi:membrane fusion protein, heavy metal efflux system
VEQNMKNTKTSLTFFACALVASSFFAQPALAGDGHDHGDAAAAVSGDAPKRLPDGSVFLPKMSQRQLGVRTQLAEEKSLPKTIELTGRVIADPNAGGRVQPTYAGRIEAGPRGLPQLGQRVRKGEVLALVRASTGALERANQVAQAAELRGILELARQRVARLSQLEGTVPAKDIEAARSEVRSLEQRLAAVGAGVSATESLIAPVSGLIAATHVTLGQVVDARELLFEIIDPTRLKIEASAFDAALLSGMATAAGAASASPAAGISIPLEFSGAGRTLREGAIPLQFRAVAGPQSAPLAVNQPVKVLVHTKELVKGFALPAGAIVKNQSNLDMVWVHTGAEQFEARPVSQVALDGATVSVTSGLKAGDRVVTQGAPLVNQVR